MRRYPWTATYTTRQYLDLLDTYSDHATLAADRRDGLRHDVTAAIERRGGVMTIPYVSLAFLARRR
jgi:hypothetical protein